MGDQCLRLADVGHEVWVGDYQACDRHGGEFPRVVHLWRPENLLSTCRHVMEGGEAGAGHLAIRWREFDPLEALDPAPEVVARHLAAPGKLLIHCRGGACRSPTLAVWAKVLRGADPGEAVVTVFLTLWRTYGVAPLLGHEALAGIYARNGLPAPWDLAPP